MREPCPPLDFDFKCVGLKSFSKFFGACFQFSRAGMYFLLLVKCTVMNRSMEAVCRKTFTSSDRLFYYLGRMTVDQITWCCNRLLHRSFQLLWRDRWHHRPVLLAIDTTDQVYYGKKNDYVSSTVKTRGRKTNEVKVLTFATISIVARQFKFTLAVFPVRNSESKAQLVEKLIRSIPGELKVHAILMDKGFYETGVMQTVDRQGYKYLIPCKQYPDLDHLYTFLEVSGEKHWRYTMHRDRPKEYTFDVYLDDMGIQRYIGFATNMDMSNRDFDTLATVYRFRWNIENGYKEAKEFRIDTNSRNHGYRVLVFAISHLLVNLYSITKRANKRAVITLTDMKDALEYILEILMPVKRPSPDRLTKHLVIVW